MGDRFVARGNIGGIVLVQDIMFKVGVTGGIGSGKSTVCRVLQRNGIPVFYADDEAQVILNNDPEVRRQIIALLGQRAYTTDGFDRKRVGSVVFNDPIKLEGLNAIMRPAVRRSFDTWTMGQTSEFVAMEAAILIESGGHRNMDHLVVVTAPMDVRVARAMKRDNASEEQIRARIAAQMSDKDRLMYADTVITNGNSVDELNAQVTALYLYLHEVAGSQG